MTMGIGYDCGTLIAEPAVSSPIEEVNNIKAFSDFVKNTFSDRFFCGINFAFLFKMQIAQ
ncbi:hypothetical protein [Desulfofarcimen acetoxidans]|uniref:hypothetical protein n=1 Tax=Desulfofarcimen acetoxidans TaxID=58138 RepID=UPI00019E4F09|nr:hypothetical protein [Desulfofarcimen acetoxidans]